ncbi:hypothetical protein V5799_014261 [Amblyomma americanum]|uniref:Uncharacterized protein n=1 Tax=Amblyomma americanum TaxID=6943 RepID=A0AAQ4E3J8_AMBAM
MTGKACNRKHQTGAHAKPALTPEKLGAVRDGLGEYIWLSSLHHLQWGEEQLGHVHLLHNPVERPHKHPGHTTIVQQK